MLVKISYCLYIKYSEYSDKKMFPIKISQCSGNLKNKDIVYKLCPSSEFAIGTWRIAISTLCCEANEDIYDFCTVTSSSSCAKRYSSEGILEIYEQPMCTVFLNLKTNGSKKSINRFSYPIWLTMNRDADVIGFRFINAQEKDILIDCKVLLTVLFQRVQ